ncbi:MAG: uroporphyrinogen decarboxylase family protein [Bacilli bacterium]|jgi:uroporphyrinogen decarboxylase
MTSKERSLAVFRGELPDRAPVCDFDNTSMLSHYGYVLNDCRANSSVSNEIMTKWAKDSMSDLVFGPIESKGIFLDIPGLEVKLPENNQGSLKNVYFNSIEEVETKDLPNPLDEKETPKFHEYVVNMLKSQWETLKDVSSPAWSEGTLTTTGFLYGAETLLMDMLLEPNNAIKVISKCAAYSEKLVRAQLERFDADYVIYTDPVASADMIDDVMFRKYNLNPLRTNITGWKRDFGVNAMLHICGDTTPMLKDLVETGARAVSLDHKVDLAEARRILGKDEVIVGNIDPVRILMKGSPEEVYAASEKCFNDAGKDGNFVFAAGCAVPIGTSLENIRQFAMVSKNNAYN